MTPEEFFENFAYVADAPNGVKKLRELILQLAVWGKLVSQDPNDEPASKLLERIRAEKTRLLKEKKIRKGVPLPVVNIEEVPYQLPHGWEWVRLGEVIEYDAADKVEPKDIPDNAWLLELEDIEKDTSKILQRRTFQEKQSKSNKARFITGDVLYGKLRPYLNKVIVADCDGYCTTEIISLRRYCGIVPTYLKFALKSPGFLDYVGSKTYGVKMPRLGTDDGRKALFSLPPENEQHRIVAKVDNLMALCDVLEARQKKEKQKLNRLNAAALNQLTTAPDAEAFNTTWQLVRDNFDLLYTSPDTIAKLRQAILQLAVQGKLVPQDPTDEPPSVLLSRIKAEKERLVKEKKIRKTDPLPPVSADEVPYSLPQGWEWARFGFFVESMTNGLYKPESFYTDNGVPSLRMYNIKEGKIIYEKLRRVRLNDDEIYTYRLNHNDILLNRVNSLELIGKAALFDNMDDIFVFESMNIRIRLIEKTIIPLFANIFMMSPYVREHIINSAKQAIGQSSVNQSQIANLIFPVPPLTEQLRIVAKVNKLMSLCEELEAKLNKSQAKAEKQTASAIQGLLGHERN